MPKEPWGTILNSGRALHPTTILINLRGVQPLHHASPIAWLAWSQRILREIGHHASKHQALHWAAWTPWHYFPGLDSTSDEGAFAGLLGGFAWADIHINTFTFWSYKECCSLEDIYLYEYLSLILYMCTKERRGLRGLVGSRVLLIHLLSVYVSFEMKRNCFIGSFFNYFTVFCFIFSILWQKTKKNNWRW